MSRSAVPRDDKPRGPDQARAVLASLLLVLLTAAPVRAWAVERVVSLNLCTDQWLVLLAPEKIAALSPLARDPALSFTARQAAGFPVTRAAAEAVLALHPDLVLGGTFGARTTLSLLERAGVRVARLAQPTDFPGIRRVLRATAMLLEVPERAEPLIAQMDSDLPLPLARAPIAPPGTSPGAPREALVWQPRGWTSGPEGLMGAVVRQAGLINLGTGGRVGLEALLRHIPALLVAGGNSGGPSLATSLLTHPAVRTIPTRAVPAPLTICGGPFTAKAVALLAN